MEHRLDGARLTIFLEGRISSDNAGKLGEEMLSLVAHEAPDSAVLDVSALDYISSAGLRTVMRLAKRVPELSIRGASPQVYDVFEMTGLCELFRVERARRQVSVEGCEVIGRGVEGTVYRLDAETIVKVYGKGTPADVAMREKTNAQACFLEGIPTAISFDVVDVDGQVGVVYELLEADNLSRLITHDPYGCDELIARFARLLRECHATELDPAAYDDNRARTLGALDYLVGVVATAEEVEKLKAVVANVPASTHFCHGDAHDGNIMVQGDELLFIDMAHVGMWHPIFDLMSMFLKYRFSGQRSYRLTAGEMEHIWDVFLRSYLDTDDEELMRKAEAQIAAFSCARNLTAVVFVPGAVAPEDVCRLKQMVIGAYDQGLEPLCFG